MSKRSEAKKKFSPKNIRKQFKTSKNSKQVGTKKESSMKRQSTIPEFFKEKLCMIHSFLNNLVKPTNKEIILVENLEEILEPTLKLEPERRFWQLIFQLSKFKMRKWI
jgi:hypothetical protein